MALTPTGSLAGFSRFPLSAGNTWTHEGTSPGGTFASQTMVVTDLFPWLYRVTNLAGATRVVVMVGAVYPSLLCMSTWSGSAADLFRFNRPFAYFYPVDFAPFTVGAECMVAPSNVTVHTPAGKFTGCYCLIVQAPGIRAREYASFWFASGVGLVQYVNPWTDGSKVMKLRHARLRGSDGAWYTISGN